MIDKEKKETATRDEIIKAACRLLCTACIGRPEGCGADPLICLKEAGLSGLMALELAETEAAAQRKDKDDAMKGEP